MWWWWYGCFCVLCAPPSLQFSTWPSPDYLGATPFLDTSSFRLVKILTVAHPLRDNLNDNMGCGPKISCLSQSGVRGPSNAHSSTRRWSMPKVSGWRSTISGHWSVNDECHGERPSRHTRIKSHESNPENPKFIFLKVRKTVTPNFVRTCRTDMWEALGKPHGRRVPHPQAAENARGTKRTSKSKTDTGSWEVKSGEATNKETRSVHLYSMLLSSMRSEHFCRNGALQKKGGA